MNGIDDLLNPNVVNDMQLLDYFAAAALPAIMEKVRVDDHEVEVWQTAVAIASFGVADAMMKERRRLKKQRAALLKKKHR